MNDLRRTTVEPAAADGDPEVARTTVEGVLPTPAETLLNLPPSLRDRYEIIRELPAGNQGTPLVVRNRETGETRLVKIHHQDPPSGYEDILDGLARGSDEHIVRIYDHGKEGRFWEEQEYCEGGSLRDLFDGGPVTDPLRQREIVQEIATALDHLHSLSPPDSDTRWVHRDIKPENTLIRSLTPFDLVLCDFGLAQLIEGSRVDGSRSGTYLYAAPEVINLDSTSPARDWWALGMIVIEMASGRHPFVNDDGAAFSLEEISYAIGVRQIDTSPIAEPRLQRLAQGLLVRDPEKRWSWGEVSSWLAGEDPELDDVEGSFGPGGRRRSTIPFDFPDPATGQMTSFTDPSLLAAAMAVGWDEASEIIFGGSERRREQRALRDFIKSANLGQEVRDVALDQLTGSRLELDRRVFSFLRALAPELPPTYKGVLLNPASLATLAASAANGDDDGGAAALVAELFDEEPMRILAAEGGRDELVELERNWIRLAETTNGQVLELASTLRRSPDSQVPPDSELRKTTLALALLLAADPSQRQVLTDQLRVMLTSDAGKIDAWVAKADAALGVDDG